MSWIRLKEFPQLLWYPLFLLLIANRLMLFIPNTISFAVFVSVILFVSIGVKKILVRAAIRHIVGAARAG
jgi:ABC-type polysaccharide transport system permease subunit